MYNAFRVELNIGHNPVTFRDVRTWEVENYTFATPEEVTAFVNERFKTYYEGCTYIKIYCVNEDGTETPWNAVGINYKHWNGFKIYYEDGNLVRG